MVCENTGQNFQNSESQGSKGQITIKQITEQIKLNVLKGHSGGNFAMLITQLLQNIFRTDLHLTGQTPPPPPVIRIKGARPTFLL